ncbi:MAG: hypothetical protein WHV28_09650 [Bacteroidota bacterium]
MKKSRIVKAKDFQADDSLNYLEFVFADDPEKERFVYYTPNKINLTEDTIHCVPIEPFFFAYYIPPRRIREKFTEPIYGVISFSEDAAIQKLKQKLTDYGYFILAKDDTSPGKIIRLTKNEIDTILEFLPPKYFPHLYLKLLRHLDEEG